MKPPKTGQANRAKAPRHIPPTQPRTVIVGAQHLVRHHITLDFEELNLEPAESIRIETLTAIHPHHEIIAAVTPQKVRDLLNIAEKRGIPLTAMHDAIDAACLSFEPAIEIAMSETGIPTQTCETAIVAAIKEANIPTYLTSRIAEWMRLSTHLLDIPRDIVPPAALQAAIKAAREHGVAEHYINILQTQTDVGQGSIFNPQPPYQNIHPSPETIIPKPRPAAVPSICNCTNCYDQKISVQAPHKDSFDTAISRHADAVALDTLIDLHQSAEQQDQADILLALHQQTLRVEHHIALNQPNTTHPYPTLITETQAAAHAARQYISQQPNPQYQNHDKPSAVQLITHLIHAEAATDLLYQEHPTQGTENNAYTAHAIYRNLCRAMYIDQELDAASDLDVDHAQELTLLPKEIIIANIDEIYTSTIHELLDTTPRVVSTDVANLPDLMHDADNAMESPLNATFTFSTNSQGKAGKPAIVRRYHQGALHFRTTDEPMPAGYPFNVVLQDQFALLTQAVMRTQELPEETFFHQAKYNEILANIGVHDIQNSAVQDIMYAAIAAGAHPGQAQQMARTALNRAPVYISRATDTETAQAAIDAARKAGADDRTLYHIADALERTDLVKPPEPVLTRHSRAIIKAAQQRGIPAPAVNLM